MAKIDQIHSHFDFETKNKLVAYIVSLHPWFIYLPIHSSSYQVHCKIVLTFFLSLLSLIFNFCHHLLHFEKEKENCIRESRQSISDTVSFFCLSFPFDPSYVLDNIFYIFMFWLCCYCCWFSSIWIASKRVFVAFPLVWFQKGQKRGQQRELVSL